MNKKLNNQKGQALFEMIIFLPFLIFLYTIFYTVGNSISSSINQQKAVRAYVYTLLKGHSYIVPTTDLVSLQGKGRTKVGFFSIGWAEHRTESDQYGNCFPFSSMLKGNSTETCDSGDRAVPGTSTFVRSFTVYGICGPVFQTVNNQFVLEQVNQMDQCSLE